MRIPEGDDRSRQLIEACRSGDEERVADLLRAGADPDAADRAQRSVSLSDGCGVMAAGWTPLMWAAWSGSVPVCLRLLDAGAQVEGGGRHSPLMAAAMGGKPETTALLLDRGADIERAGGGDTALTWAAIAGRTEVVRLLLDRGANPDCGGSADGQSVFSNGFYSAIYQRHPEVVRLLLDAGVDPNARNPAGWTPLLRASASGFAEIVELLLAAGARSELSDAAARGDLERMRAQLDGGASPNERDAEGGLPIERAVRGGHREAVRLLLDRGADPNAGEALPLAVSHDRPEIVALLLERGAALDEETGAELLLGAAGDGSAEIVRVLLARGIPAGTATSAGIPVLCCAAYSGDRETVRLLLDGGADPNSATEDGVSAVRTASEEDHEEIVRLLWERGADIGVAEAAMIGEHARLAELLSGGADPDDSAGDGSALVLAVKRGDIECVRLLLRAGADRARSPWPPVWAVIADQLAILELLLDVGWPLDQPDTTGRTPLHRAVERQRTGMVRLLRARGADPNSRDRMGQTPLELARKLGNTELEELLV